MLKLFEGVEIAPLRSLDEFLFAKSRYDDTIKQINILIQNYVIVKV